MVVLLVITGSGAAIVMVEEPTPVPISGSIHVDGVPVGMAVSLDGVPYGNVPESGVLELVQIPIGGHTIGATMSGYEQKDTQITVLDGQITRVRVELVAIRTGSLEVQSTPQNVQVYLDDLYKGITPVILNDVSSGDHMVILKLDGYQDWSSPVTITPGGEQIISGTLERKSSGGTGQPAPVATSSAGILPGVVLIGIFVSMLIIQRTRR